MLAKPIPFEFERVCHLGVPLDNGLIALLRQNGRLLVCFVRETGHFVRRPGRVYVFAERMI